MFGNLLKAAISTVMLPVDAVSDIATFAASGMLTNEESAIKKRLENIGANIDAATDPDEE